MLVTAEISDFLSSGGVEQCADADRQFGKCFHLCTAEEQCSPGDVCVVQDRELVLGLTLTLLLVWVPVHSHLINSVAAQGTQETFTGIPTPDNSVMRWKLDE